MSRTSRKTTAPHKLSRPPLERMSGIHQALAGGKYPNCNTLALILEVSPKTVRRDIDFMRDRQNMPIEFDPRRNGYYYTEPVDSLPAIQVTEGEVIALYFARKVLEQYKGTPFEKPLEAAFNKLTAGLRDSISLPPGAMDEAVSIRDAGMAAAGAEIFHKLHQAITAREETVIGYRSLAAKKPRPLWVRPYHLLGASSAWYLIAEDMERGEFRVFTLARVSRVEPRGTFFTRLTDFDPRHLLRGSLGVYLGRDNHRIRVRFDAFAAQLVRERQWHQSQRIRELPGEGIEVTMVLSSLFEVERWILSWGPHAEVVEPPELRELILSKAEAMVGVYAGMGFAPRHWTEEGPGYYMPLDFGIETSDPRSAVRPPVPLRAAAPPRPEGTEDLPPTKPPGRDERGPYKG